MASSRAPFGLVMPIRNEAIVLRETLPALLHALEDGPAARLICACNGTEDDSVAVIRALGGDRVEVLDLAETGKIVALQAGDDALGELFPRIYMDADVILSPGGFDAVLTPLRTGQADLVGARRVHRTEGVSRISAGIARTWDALPHAREAGFLGVVGLSARARGAWDRWPAVLGDDIFMAAQVPPDRRMIPADVTASTRPPADFRGWVRMRARWLNGEAELRAMGLSPPHTPGQREALRKLMLTPATAPGAVAFAAARLLAPLVPDLPRTEWTPDRTCWK